MTDKSRVCEVCGDGYEPTNKDQTCCSPECGYEKMKNRVEVDCDYCDSKITKKQSQLDTDHHFCGYDCRTSYFNENRWPNEVDKIQVECATCGDEIETYPHENGRKTHSFCDKDCHGKWISEHQTGEDHPNYTKKEVKCWWCGDSLNRPKWQRDMNDRDFCNRECHNKWKKWAKPVIGNDGTMTGEFDRDLPRWLWLERKGHLEPA